MAKYAPLAASPWNVAQAVEDGAMHIFHVATSTNSWWMQSAPGGIFEDLGETCSSSIDDLAKIAHEQSGSSFPCAPCIQAPPCIGSLFRRDSYRA
jgi:hypothetical protein